MHRIAAVAFLLPLVVGSSLASAGAVLDRVKARGEMVAAVDAAWPPFQFQKEDGTFDGYDVELVSEVAKRLGLRARFKTPSFSTVLSGTWQGEWDLAPSITPTAQRSVNLDFPVIYEYSLSVLAVHRDNSRIRTPADVSRKRIGVQKSTEYEQYLTREPFDVLNMPPIVYKIEDPIVVTFETADESFEALAKGDGKELDGVINSLSTIMSEIKNGRPFKVVGSALMYTPSALAIEKGDPEFAAVLKQTIDGLSADGTLTAISKKWVGIDTAKP